MNEKIDYNSQSNFIRKLVQNPKNHSDFLIDTNKIPKKIVQFWDKLDKIPFDVKECIDTWAYIEDHGFERNIFDKQQAKDYIFNNLGVKYLQAFEKCYHPAMQSDYFRLCYIFIEGGCYIDADDVFSGKQIGNLFTDCRLKIQPLCYDTATHMMVSPHIFTKRNAYSPTWIFYFNNNPLIACSRHPVIEKALTKSTYLLGQNNINSFPEIQSTTGPGVLTTSIYEIISEQEEMKYSIQILNDWEDFAKSNWELEYRKDSRNWRNSNCKFFKEH